MKKFDSSLVIPIAAKTTAKFSSVPRTFACLAICDASRLCGNPDAENILNDPIVENINNITEFNLLEKIYYYIARH